MGNDRLSLTWNPLGITLTRNNEEIVTWEAPKHSSCSEKVVCPWLLGCHPIEDIWVTVDLWYAASRPTFTRPGNILY